MKSLIFFKLINPINKFLRSQKLFIWSSFINFRKWLIVSAPFWLGWISAKALGFLSPDDPLLVLPKIPPSVWPHIAPVHQNLRPFSQHHLIKVVRSAFSLHFCLFFSDSLPKMYPMLAKFLFYSTASTTSRTLVAVPNIVTTPF